MQQASGEGMHELALRVNRNNKRTVELCVISFISFSLICLELCEPIISNLQDPAAIHYTV